ncbi:hypothetical protein PRNP1_014751 [Phytophthora ramorum]
MEDLPSPSGAPAPGTPRPRTRGARRRPPTPSPQAKSSRQHKYAGFPALTAPQRPLTAAASSPVKSASIRGATASDRRSFVSCEDQQSLGERLHASGLKRSVVQAQLFPHVKPPGLVPRKRRDMQAASNNQTMEESSLRYKPLVASLNVNPTGSVLIPSRPVAATTPRQRFLTSTNTVREYGSEEAREPMSARDRYYVEQRATTAPEGARHHLRPPERKTVETQEVLCEGGSNNQSNKVESGGGDSPRRGDLLARRNEIKTLTEKLVDGLTQRADVDGMDGGPAAAYALATPSGAAPRDSFFYLRRVDSNPYNLEVTSHSKINPKDYYTVSRLGITHFASDGVEFQPLQKFERENYIYSLLVKLPFFKKYRIWKRFTIWKQAVSARKRLNAFASLNNSLFILLPHLHEALLQLRHACLDLQDSRLFDFEHPMGPAEAAGWGVTDATSAQQQQKTYTLTEFSLRLKAQKTRVERVVDHFISDAEMTAKHACEKYLYSFLQNTGFNDIKPTGSARSGRKRSSVVAAQRKESTVGREEENRQKPMTYTERATMRTQCRRITKFLRVVEFLISDALLRMAISSTVLLRDALATYIRGCDDDDGSGGESPCDGAPKRRLTLSILPQSVIQPLLRVEVVLKSTAESQVSHISASSKHRRATRTSTVSTVVVSNSTRNIKTNMRGVSSGYEEATELLEFIPSTEKLRSQLETLVFNGLTAVTNRERLIRNPMFKIYVEASTDDGSQGGDGDDGGEISSEGMDLDILIMEDATFVETLQSLNSIILDAYEHAEENCSELSLFLQRYQEDARFCKEVSDPSRYLDTDVHDFRGYLDKYMMEAQEVDTVADSASCGLLLLDRAYLNGYLKPSPRQCLDGLYELIPVVFRQLNDSLTNEFAVTNERIGTIPTTVDEFSASLAYLRELQAGYEDMEEKYRDVRSLYHLLEEYRVKVTDTDQMNAFLLTQKRSQLKATIDLFESSCEQYTAKFGVELEARLPSLVSKLATVSDALSNPILFDLKSDINDTIIYLTQVEGDVLRLETTVKQHFEHEKTLGLPMTTAFDEMDELKLDLALKIDMWKAFREWSGAVSSWEKQQFPDEVEFTTITDHVERVYVQILKWEQQLSEGMSALCTYLKSSVEEYRVVPKTTRTTVIAVALGAVALVVSGRHCSTA